MAKVAINFEQPTHQHIQMPVTGRWIWKEEGLEFISNNPNADKQDKRRRAKGGHHAELNNKRNDRVQSGVGRNHGIGRGRQHKRSSRVRSPRPAIKQTGEHTTVTLNDIKNVALDMLSEVDDVSQSFEGLFNTEQFDRFLQYLLSYFHCFFDKMAQENKKNPMFIEPSLAEKKAYADACARLEVAQKLLGQSYCILVLGMGLEHQHHMACGHSRVSSTYKDRDMYETLYSFCAFVVWITFRRKEDYESIKKEIGRMLRSDTFNPAIRIKNAPDEPKETKDGQKKEEKKEPKPETEVKKDPKAPEKLTPAEYRRLHPKRPAIKSIITQRSPAVVSILPSPKEESHWLFNTRAAAPDSLSKNLQDIDTEEDEKLKEMVSGLIINKKTFKIGILGELLNGFNPVTLTPMGAENEDEENEEDGEKQQNGDDVAEKSPPPDRGVSRQHTAISQATVDVHSDED